MTEEETGGHWIKWHGGQGDLDSITLRRFIWAKSWSERAQEKYWKEKLETRYSGLHFGGRREIGQSSEVKKTFSSWTLENNLGDAGERGENSRAASLSSGRGRDLAHQYGWRIKCVQVAWWGEWWRPNRAIQPQVRLEFCRDQIIKGLPFQAQMFGLCPFVNGVFKGF